MSGPLEGLRLVELGGLGPVPFAGMLLSNLGVEVVRFRRPGGPDMIDPVMGGGRIVVDEPLDDPATQVLARRLATRADAVLEGFRPGVTESFGLDPGSLHQANPRLVYARSTGWGTDGPFATLPGHDINYIATSGAMSSVRGPGGAPVPPPGLIGDFGGAGMLLALGIVSAVHSARETGVGQVVSTSILAGSAVLTAQLWGARGMEGPMRGVVLGLQRGEAPFYNVYECADGGHVTVGAFEPHFYSALCEALDLTGDLWANQYDRSTWAPARAELAAVFASRPSADWAAHFEGSRACVAVVVELDDAPSHPVNRANQTYVERDGLPQPNVEPRFTTTPGRLRSSVEQPLDEVVLRWEAGPGRPAG